MTLVAMLAIMVLLAFGAMSIVASSLRTPRELLCMICGRDYPVWYADNDLWNAVERQPDGSDEHPFLCTSCFMQRAICKGINPVFRLSDGRRTETVRPLSDLPHNSK